MPTVPKENSAERTRRGPSVEVHQSESTSAWTIQEAVPNFMEPTTLVCQFAHIRTAALLYNHPGLSSLSVACQQIWE